MANSNAFSSFSFPVKAAPNLKLSAYKVYVSEDEFTVVEASSAANAVQDSGIMAPLRVEHMSEESRTMLGSETLQATEERREINVSSGASAPIRFEASAIPERSAQAFEPFVFGSLPLEKEQAAEPLLPQTENGQELGTRSHIDPDDTLAALPDTDVVSAETLVEAPETDVLEDVTEWVDTADEAIEEIEDVAAEAKTELEQPEKAAPEEIATDAEADATQDEAEAIEPPAVKDALHVSEEGLSEEEVAALMAEHSDI